MQEAFYENNEIVLAMDFYYRHTAFVSQQYGFILSEYSPANI